MFKKRLIIFTFILYIFIPFVFLDVSYAVESVPTDSQGAIFLEKLPGMEDLGDKARESFKDGKDGGGTVLKTYIN